ncbi:MAG: hypothetical protein IIT65_12120 [Lachnospiraceae bacterium]|nr:hypothetical protein [Lachnospiraceae bacterium]
MSPSSGAPRSIAVKAFASPLTEIPTSSINVFKVLDSLANSSIFLGVNLPFSSIMSCTLSVSSSYSEDNTNVLRRLLVLRMAEFDSLTSLTKLSKSSSPDF